MSTSGAGHTRVLPSPAARSSAHTRLVSYSRREDLASAGQIWTDDDPAGNRVWRPHPTARMDSGRRHTDDAAAVLQRCAAGPAIVVGWSIGGVIALDLAVRRPDLVAGVVVIEAPLFAKRRPRPDMVRGIVAAKLAARRGDPRAGAAHFLNWALKRRGERVGDLARLPDPWRDTILANAPAILREIDASTGEAELSPAALRGLACPVRWLHGDRSAVSFRAAARRATGLIPNLTVVPVGEAGHVLQHDQPDAVVTAVTDLVLATR